MSILICEKHGETGLIPTASKNLSDSMMNRDAQLEDVTTIYLRVYDEGDFLFEKILYTHKIKDMTRLKDEYVIKNDEDDQIYSNEVHPILVCGGSCAKCFKEYMERIDFDLNNLQTPSGLTF